jgi:hypothetical protein
MLIKFIYPFEAKMTLKVPLQKLLEQFMFAVLSPRKQSCDGLFNDLNIFLCHITEVNLATG